MTMIQNISCIPTNQRMLKYIVTDVEERGQTESKKQIDHDLAHTVMMNIDKHGMPSEWAGQSRKQKKQLRMIRLLINYCLQDRNIEFSNYLNEEQMGMLMLFKLNRF